MRVFWDTNLFIYFIERHPLYYLPVLKLYTQCRARRDQLLTSSLTLGEVLAQPLRTGNIGLLNSYRELLQNSGAFSIVNFTAACAENYAQLRAHTKHRQPDAMQIACAMEAGADLFVTNDQKLWGTVLSTPLRIQGIDASLDQEGKAQS